MGTQLTGSIERHERGFGFLVPDETTLEDVFIPPGQLKGAMTGDRVEVEIRNSNRDKKDVGHVTRILKRGVQSCIGTLKITSDKSIVIPDSVRLGTPIRVPDQRNNTRVNDGDLVEVDIENYDPLQGVIVDVLGDRDDPEVEEEVILKKYDLNPEFPDDVVEEAKSFPDSVSGDQLEERRDLTHLTTLTIDPYDAKDLDDAVSIESLDDGTYRVGVHITDVSHYVDTGSKLDEEARERGTSTYLAGEVLPMFPKAFSNGIGSLDEQVLRLTVTVFLKVNDSGEVLDSDFAVSYINVDQRLSYQQVDDYLNNEDYPEEIDDISDTIDRMVDVSQAMRRKRFDRGSLDFDLPEVSLKMQEGEVEDIIQVEHTRSHQAIEEFMIAANEAVAVHLTSKEIPVLYRIHEPPARTDIDEFERFVEGIGYQLEYEDNVHPRDFQEIIDQSQDKPEEKVIAWNMLRAMQKARYSTDNMGHFGLASDCYLHFTSPIRRYPDLTAHRILKRDLTGKEISGNQKKRLQNDLQAMSTHLSEREQNATEAERESRNVKLLTYMKDKIGEEYVGYISSVMPFGCFVQLKNTVEGLIHVSTLDDYYVYDEDNYALIGERSGNVLHIGDRVEVEVARIDIPSRELDFQLLEVVESGVRVGRQD
ncbi:MAG: ribonuclease R [bacterium]